MDGGWVGGGGGKLLGKRRHGSLHRFCTVSPRAPPHRTPVTVFRLDKKSPSVTRRNIVLAQNALSRLRTVRHPNILRFVVSSGARPGMASSSSALPRHVTRGHAPPPVLPPAVVVSPVPCVPFLLQAS